MRKKGIIQNTRTRMSLQMRKPRVNRKYRDRLFCALFGQDKEALLQLYNALHGTSYTDSGQLTVVTLDNIIYMKMTNDLAFVIAGVLNLYEHQSTYNPNMPLRFLLYIAEEYDAIIQQQDANIYGDKLVMLPTPQCVVFYNGDRDIADEELLHLSDAFQNREISADLELTVHLRNINPGHNKALMTQCHKLWEYSTLVSQVKENLAAGMEKGSAVEEAVRYCLDQGILTDFLTANRSGVLGMLRLLTEYNEKEHMRRLKRDSRIEGALLQSREDILDLLQDIAPIPEDIIARVSAEENGTILRRWLKAAARATDIDDFRNRMDTVTADTVQTGQGN